MKDWVKAILWGGLSVLFFAAAFGDDVHSYEDIEISRGIIITQNGTTDEFSVTDKKGRSVGGDFTGIKAAPYDIVSAIAAGVTSKLKLKQAVSTYINNHISRIKSDIPAKLSLLAMDSLLYSYRQQNLADYHANYYHISYSMLIQKNGDYVILEERLTPTAPVILVAHYIGRNTGSRNLPAGVQFSEQDRLIVAMVDERGNYIKSFFPAQTLTATLYHNPHDYPHYKSLERTTVTITTHHTVMAITAYHPADWEKHERINPRDVHECVLGIADPARVTNTLTADAPLYTVTTSTAITVAKAFCAGADSLKKLVEENNDLDSVVGIIYGVIDNPATHNPAMGVIKRYNFVPDCDNGKIHGDTEWKSNITMIAYVNYYWLNPDTWDMQFLQIAQLNKNITSHLKAAREFPSNFILRSYARVAEPLNGSVIAIFPNDFGDIVNDFIKDNVHPPLISGVIATVFFGRATVFHRESIAVSVTASVAPSVIASVDLIITVSPVIAITTSVTVLNTTFITTSVSSPYTANVSIFYATTTTGYSVFLHSDKWLPTPITDVPIASVLFTVQAPYICEGTGYHGSTIRLCWDDPDHQTTVAIEMCNQAKKSSPSERNFIRTKIKVQLGKSVVAKIKNSHNNNYSPDRRGTTEEREYKDFRGGAVDIIKFNMPYNYTNRGRSLQLAVQFGTSTDEDGTTLRAAHINIKNNYFYDSSDVKCNIKGPPPGPYAVYPKDNYYPNNPEGLYCSSSPNQSLLLTIKLSPTLSFPPTEKFD